MVTMRGARRSWSAEEKRRIVEESLRPGASVSVVARRHDLNANLLFTWRRQARGKHPVRTAVAVGRRPPGGMRASAYEISRRAPGPGPGDEPARDTQRTPG